MCANLLCHFFVDNGHKALKLATDACIQHDKKAIKLKRICEAIDSDPISVATNKEYQKDSPELTMSRKEQQRREVAHTNKKTELTYRTDRGSFR